MRFGKADAARSVELLAATSRCDSPIVVMRVRVGMPQADCTAASISAGRNRRVHVTRWVRGGSNQLPRCSTACGQQLADITARQIGQFKDAAKNGDTGLRKSAIPAVD